MRGRIVVAICALVLAGCGGDDVKVGPTTSVVAPDTATAPPAGSEPPTSTTLAPATTAVAAGPVRYVSPYAKVATPQELAHEIDDAERIARDPMRPPNERAAAGRRAQMRYRQLVDTPAWDAPVAAALPPARRADTARLVEAGRQLLAMFTTFPDTMPPWEIVDPAPPADLLRHYKDAQAAIGVDWTLLAAVNFVEWL
jgi:hypothetical protein